jgi:phosphate starvation-inducible PhoH-like protein
MSKHEEGKTQKRRSVKMMNSREESSKIVKAVAKNDGQKNVLRAIDENVVTIINGVAGTGKTFLAVSYGLQMLFRGKFKRIVITRPYVEAGEHLGFLPGSFEDKTAPFLVPIFDTIGEHLSRQDIDDFIEEGRVVVMPLAYMRGVTFKDSYVVCDEAQNASPKQFHMLLTRIGEKSKVVVTGDPSQSDLTTRSGLADAITRLDGIKGLEIVHLDASCVVREPIVAEIDQRYAK